MTTKFKMITSAQSEAVNHRAVYTSFSSVAESLNEDTEVLMESASDILADIREALTTKKPLTSLGVSPASLAGLIAGIEYIVEKLPQMDATKRVRVLKVLGNVSIAPKMTLTLVQAIADLAEKNLGWKTITTQMEHYAETGEADGELVQRVSTLLYNVDRAIRSTTAQNTAEIQRPPTRG